jgi:heat shock protein HslJ
MLVLGACLPLLCGCAALVTPDKSSSTARSTQPAPLRGMYSYLADAPLFVDCSSGKRMPVAMVADNRALERAYLQERQIPGEPLLVILEGRIEPMAPMEGPGLVDTLIPERFIGIQTENNCATPVGRPGLLNTRWRLYWLGEKRAVQYPGQREPHIRLHPDNRVTGSDACNLISGTFEAENNRMLFSPVASTRMACPQGMGQERDFRGALAKTVRYRIVDEYLELQDGDGACLARFVAELPGSE